MVAYYFFQFSHLPKLGIFTQLPKVNCVQKQLRGKVCVEKTQPTSVQKNQEISSAFPQPPRQTKICMLDVNKFGAISVGGICLQISVCRNKYAC